MLSALRAIDATDGPISESSLSEALMAAVADTEALTEEGRRGALALVGGCSFQREWGSPRSPWGIYWSERGSGTASDGSAFYSPDVADVRDDTLEAWIELAGSLRHPLLFARFADLAWEIGRHVRSQRRSTSEPITVDIPRELATLAIDGYLRVVEERLFIDEFQGWQLLERALGLASSLNDLVGMARAKGALLALRRYVASTGGKHLWWKFDELCWQYKIPLALTPAEDAEILDALRAAAAALSDISKPESFDPHAATGASERLRRRLVGEAGAAEAKSAQVAAAVAFERAAEKASALVAVGWLEALIPRYRQLGYPADAARIERKVRELAPAVAGEMKVASVDLEIPQDELERFVDEMAGATLAEGALNIAKWALARRSEAESSAIKMLDEAPLFARVNISLQHPSGFTAATIGSVEDDLPGRAINNASTQIGHYSSMLNLVFTRWREKHHPTIDDLLTMLGRSPAFASGRTPLLSAGLSAWLDGDAFKAMHVLIPQIECAVREIAAAMGGSVMAYEAHFDGFKVKPLGSLLSSDIFAERVPSDIVFHLRALYSDPKGINLRNQVAHGIASASMLSMNMANWVVHTLLVFCFAFSREARAGQSEEA